MITRAYEFEIFADGDFYVALPYDLEGGTQGKNFSELCTMLCDWLKIHLEEYDMRETEPPEPSYGNKPRHGGKNMLVCVSAGRETIPTMSATEAARTLGVSVSRISQLIASHQMSGWKEGRNARVAIASVESRLREKPRPGRPKKHPDPEATTSADAVEGTEAATGSAAGKARSIDSALA